MVWDVISFFVGSSASWMRPRLVSVLVILLFFLVWWSPKRQFDAVAAAFFFTRANLYYTGPVMIIRKKIIPNKVQSKYHEHHT